MRFSPIGNGGKRVLAMAEPADLVHVVDAVSWEAAQTITFWGEVGGVEFTPDADELVVANCDRWVGGIMTFGRKKGVGWYQDGGGRDWGSELDCAEDGMMEDEAPKKVESQFHAPMEVEDDFLVPAGAGIKLGRRETCGGGRRWKRLGADFSEVFT